MNINGLFNNISDINFSEYLFRCGISNPTQYLKARIVEDTTKYNNIDEARDLILKYVKGGDANVD